MKKAILAGGYFYMQLFFVQRRAKINFILQGKGSRIFFLSPLS